MDENIKTQASSHLESEKEKKTSKAVPQADADMAKLMTNLNGKKMKNQQDKQQTSQENENKLKEVSNRQTSVNSAPNKDTSVAVETNPAETSRVDDKGESSDVAMSKDQAAVNEEQEKIIIGSKQITNDDKEDSVDAPTISTSSAANNPIAYADKPEWSDYFHAILSNGKGYFADSVDCKVDRNVLIDSIKYVFSFLSGDSSKGLSPKQDFLIKACMIAKIAPDLITSNLHTDEQALDDIINLLPADIEETLMGPANQMVDFNEQDFDWSNFVQNNLSEQAEELTTNYFNSQVIEPVNFNGAEKIGDEEPFEFSDAFNDLSPEWT